MADITNIRLTDFIQGLQEEDVLDYPSNAVRAGGNVTLAETIQTRGGISTVDSVGLPANSEIMAIQQVKFPTNEKTFLLAQVHVPTSETPQDFESDETYIHKLDNYTPNFFSTKFQIGGLSDYGTSYAVLTDYQIYLDDNRILNLEMSESGVTDSRQGDAVVYGNWEEMWTGEGIRTNTANYLRFPNQIDADWFSAFENADVFVHKFKIKFVFNGEEAYVGRTTILCNYDDFTGETENWTTLTLGEDSVNIGHFSEWSGYVEYPSELIIEDGAELAFTLTVAMSEEGIDEYGNPYRYYDDWSLTIGTDYADTPTPESWSLYAMPDTLPDTGA